MEDRDRYEQEASAAAAAELEADLVKQINDTQKSLTTISLMLETKILKAQKLSEMAKKIKEN